MSTLNLTVKREWFTGESVISEFYVDDKLFCFALEDIERTVKIKGQTAIPVGTYAVKITESKRFGRPMPLLVDVPGFEGVRIHPGNTAADTEGCILVGKTRGSNFIGRSKEAFDSLFKVLSEHSGDIKITIEDVTV